MLISPSLLSANFLNLEPDIEMVNRSRAAMLHLDVMDGVFVPNISFGFPVIEAVARKCEKQLDAHLMIVNPQNYIGACRDAGVHIMNVHQEATPHLDRVINQIRQAGMLPAVTLCPATPIELLRDILPELHMVQLMSVNPGFSGQKFIPYVVDKVARLKALINETGSHALIEVDGGVNLETGALLANAGADVLVAGSAIFKAQDPEAYIAELQAL